MTFATVRDGRLKVGPITPAEVPGYLAACRDDAWIDACAIYEGQTQVAKWRRS